MSEKELPERKGLRLKRFDYSTGAAYFITICSDRKRCIFGKVVGDDACDVPRRKDDACDVPYADLNRVGSIIEYHLKQMNTMYDNVAIDKYVVMPNHNHFILMVYGEPFSERDSSDELQFGTSQASSPTKVLRGSSFRQHEIVPKFVSLLKRYVNRDLGYNIWQRSYYDHIIRDEADYKNIWHYIDNNPARWTEDAYYVP